MQIFVDYIEPLTQWLYAHPAATLFLTFLVAFLESVAIIGSIIPGSVTMTAIGILAGTGIIRIDLTLIAAALGAIAGDGFSYFIGYIYSDRLTTFWPFSKYPNLFSYGQIYFEKHGGKSVLIGRFIGPLRSIIPVIAGMMHMPQGRFFIANVFSAIGWAFLYVTPGILIGAASHELSTEQATGLVLFILMMLVAIWLFTMGVKALYLRCRLFFNSKINYFWKSGLQSSLTKPFFECLTPSYEKNHTVTASLFFSLLLSLICFFWIMFYRFDSDFVDKINTSTNFMIQSFRTRKLDIFFVSIQQSLTMLPVFSLFALTGIFLSIKQNLKTTLQWCCFGLFTLIALHLIHFLLPIDFIPLPVNILGDKSQVLFLPPSTTFSIACYFGVMLHNLQSRYFYSKIVFSWLLMCCIFLGGVGALYVGEVWLSDLVLIYLFAGIFSLTYWIIYRKTLTFYHHYSALFSRMGLLVLLSTTSLSCSFHLTQTLQNNQIYFTQHIISHVFWWNQDKPLLPLFSRNRVGKITGVFNLQYVGKLSELQKVLQQKGFETYKPSFMATLKRVADTPSIRSLSWNENFYLHRRAVLTMFYHQHKDRRSFRLQLWRSNYYLQSFNNNIFIGHIQEVQYQKHNTLLNQEKAKDILMKRLLHKFRMKQVKFSEENQLPLSFTKSNSILLIEQNLLPRA